MASQKPFQGHWVFYMLLVMVNAKAMLSEVTPASSARPSTIPYQSPPLSATKQACSSRQLCYECSYSSVQVVYKQAPAHVQGGLCTTGSVKRKYRNST